MRRTKEYASVKECAGKEAGNADYAGARNKLKRLVYSCLGSFSLL